MNLALRDISYHRGRFLMTCVGVGLLLTIVLAMMGIYNGLVYEALIMVRAAGADLWVVQEDTRGPFAEQSRLPEDVRYRVSIVPGVARASPFVFYTIQRQHRGRPLRFVVIGYDLHTGMGGPPEIVAGRRLWRKRYEMVADVKLGLALGEVIRLGLHDYTVVGLTRNMMGSGGDPVAFFSLADAQEIQFVKDNWAIRNARERAVVAYQRALPTQPVLSTDLARKFADNPDLHQINAVLVRLDPLGDPQAVAREIERWGHFTVFTADEQCQLLLMGNVDRARRQLGLFRTILTIVATVIVTLIIYTMTLEKLKTLSLLKLIGAPNMTIMGLILQQSVSLGVIGFGVALVLGNFTFDLFPRLVIVSRQDVAFLFVMVLAISLVASLAGIRKALSVEAGAALTG